MLDISGTPTIVQDISVSFENSTLSVAVIASVPVHAAPLLHLIGNALTSQFTDISVSCRNSNLSVLVNLSNANTLVGGNGIAMAATFIAMKDGLVYNINIERVSVAFVSSSFSSVLSADSTSGLYVNSDIGLVLVRCTKFQVGSPALLKNVVFSSTGTVSYSITASVPRISSDTFSVVYISYFSEMDTLLVSFEGLTLLSLEDVCGGANCGVALLRWPTVRMVEVAGTASVTQMLNVSIIASRANIFTRTPKSAVLFKCSDALALHNISFHERDVHHREWKYVRPQWCSCCTYHGN